MDVNELKRWQAYYESKLRGPRKYNKWIVTSGGAKIQSFPFTPQQMQWLDSQKWFAKLVFATFKISPSELGFTEDLNRATGIQQMQINKSRAIRPILRLLEEHINRKIVWMHFSKNVKFEFLKELDLDEKGKQADIDTKRLAAGLDSVNELRDRDGKEKWEDEKWDLPDAQSQSADSEGMGTAGDMGDFGSSDTDVDWDEIFQKMMGAGSGTIDGEVLKQAMAMVGSGEPGYVPMPLEYDGMKQPVKLKDSDKKMQEAVKEMLASIKAIVDEKLDGVLR